MSVRFCKESCQTVRSTQPIEPYVTNITLQNMSRHWREKHGEMPLFVVYHSITVESSSYEQSKVIRMAQFHRLATVLTE